MKRHKITLILLFFTFNLVFSANPDVEPILEALFNKSKEISGLEMDLLIQERIDGEMVKSKNFIKYNSNPVQVYIKQYYIKEGMEILYNSLEENSKALVYTNAFPWITVSLDPLGNLMRKESHHSIFKSGFEFVIGLLQNAVSLYEGKLDEICTYQGLVKYDGRICYKLQLEMPMFDFIDYKVLPGETMESLSHKLKVNDYMILERNPQLKNFQDIEPGDVIKVPNAYAKSITLYIEKERNIIAGVKIYDDKGLFEDYVYQDVIINPAFTKLDFSTENPEYNVK